MIENITKYIQGCLGNLYTLAIVGVITVMILVFLNVLPKVLQKQGTRSNPTVTKRVNEAFEKVEEKMESESSCSDTEEHSSLQKSAVKKDRNKKSLDSSVNETDTESKNSSKFERKSKFRNVQSQNNKKQINSSLQTKDDDDSLENL